MSNDKISSLELIAALSEQSGITKKTATAFMRQFMITVEDALLRDGMVKIKGLGVFKIVWNESRTSVNVQTGERYEIAGHNKITFLPDDELRDIVNRPFAHLEAVDLDGNTIAKPQEIPEEEVHLKRFSEQASEIMSIISDLQNIQPPKSAKTKKQAAPKAEPIKEAETVIVPQAVVEMPAIETVEPKEETIASMPETIASPVAEVKEVVLQSQLVVDLPKEKIAAVSQPEPEVNESKLVARMAAQPTKKSLKWLWISLVIVALLAIGVVLCYLFCPYFTGTQPTAPQVTAPKASVVLPVPVAAKPDTIAQPKAQPETPKDVFAQPREYKDFIATETATEESRLTLYALKYYGHKVFWVYIYEANKATLKNPNVLSVGAKIKIPKLDPALINKHDARCFQKASELQTLYTK